MIRLVLSDLLLHAHVWLGSLAVTATTGFVAAIAAGLIETGAVHGGRVQEGLASTSSAVIMFTAVAALVVLASTANLAVALQQRSYALWQLVGIRPALVGLVVLMQLAVIGAVGALIGGLVAVPVFDPLFAWVFREWEDMQGISLHLSPVSLLAVLAVVTAVVVLGGLRGARHARRTPPIEALRDAEPPRVRIGWFRLVILAGTLAGAVALATALDGTASISAFSGQAMLLTPLIAATFAAAGPFLFPLVLAGWTSLVPARVSATWHLARASARHRLSRSTAAIGPLMVAVALAGGLYTLAGTLGAHAARTGSDGRYELAPEGVVLLLGGPLLLSAVAAAATVFMSGHAREREFALLQAAGSTPRTVMAAAVWEAVVYATTAAILGTVATALGGAVIAAALALPLPAVSFTTLGIVAGGGFLLILVATTAPTAAALRHPVPRSLTVE